MIFQKIQIQSVSKVRKLRLQLGRKLFVTVHKNQEPIQNQNFLLPTKNYYLTFRLSVTSTNFRATESLTEELSTFEISFLCYQKINFRNTNSKVNVDNQ